MMPEKIAFANLPTRIDRLDRISRSEERRVGEECR